jgi:sugar phosphate isomerase/epimerase
MSGLPAGPGDRHPNWVTVSWPPEVSEMLEWQWESVVLPDWRELVPFANDHGVHKLALQMHGHQIVYNVPTFERLRDTVGLTVGVNLDPSHLMWMGADPIASIRALGDAVYHVDAKNTRIEPASAIRSRLETMPREGDPTERGWNFVTLGDGHDLEFWTEFCTALREVGYDDVLSIEHEDMVVDAIKRIRITGERLRTAFGEQAPVDGPAPPLWPGGAERRNNSTPTSREL